VCASEREEKHKYNADYVQLEKTVRRALAPAIAAFCSKLASSIWAAQLCVDFPVAPTLHTNRRSLWLLIEPRLLFKSPVFACFIQFRYIKLQLSLTNGYILLCNLSKPEL
jgi:hypothetical protein